MDIRKWYNFNKLKRNHNIYIITMFSILFLGLILIMISQIILQKSVSSYSAGYISYKNIDFKNINYKNNIYSINFFSIFNIGIAGILKMHIFGVKDNVYIWINSNSIKYIAFIGFILIEVILPIMILIYSVSFIIFWADINTTTKKTIKYIDKKSRNIKIFQDRNSNLLRESRIKSAIGK